jgi:hypothetical protein
MKDDSLRDIIQHVDLTIEEIEGNIVANEAQGGDYNDGATAVLANQLAEWKELRAMLAEYATCGRFLR